MEDEELKTMTDALLEQLPIGVILMDINGGIVFINRTAERIRKIKRENMLGQSVIHCHGEKSKTNVQRAMDNLVKKPETVYRRMVDDSANGKYYINTYAGVVNGQNQTIGMAVLTEDVTEKRKLEMERATTYRIMQETTNNLEEKYHELLLASLETIAKILETRDPYTCDHSRKVSEYALKMYEACYGIGGDYYTVKTAAALHDIGKIGIPDGILRKPGPLSPEEYEKIKRHSIISEEILKPLDSGTSISKIVRYHHERYDGHGYPDGLRGEEIPVASRIIAIADTFDAMSSNRPYRQAMPYQHCLDEIATQAGKQFDPTFTEVFLDLANTGSL